MVEGLHFRERRKPEPDAEWSIPHTIRISTSPSIPKAWTERPEMEPPQRATFTVSPMERLSLALFDVRTFAYVALFIPVMHAALEASAPRSNVIPAVFSTKREKITATIRTTMNMVLYSVFMKVSAPLLMIPAISTISAVPSFMDFILL